MSNRRAGARDTWEPLAAWAILVAALAALQAATTSWTGWRTLLTARLSWDGGTYVTIATDGYAERTAGWFPGLPLLVRAAEVVVGDWMVAWLLVALVSGAATAALFWRWCGTAGLDPKAQRTALAFLLLYPFGFHLLGFPYTEAPFLACAIGAFLLIERGQHLGAGVAAFVAAGLRPTGVVLVVALVVRAWELRSTSPDRTATRRWRGALPLLGLLAPIAYSAYGAHRFGDPFIYARIQQDITDGLQPDVPASWPPYAFVTRLPTLDRWTHQLGAVVQGALTLAATLALPRVLRRFGWGAATYVAGITLLIWTGSWEFSSAGRYLVAAFPLAALAGEPLAARPRFAATLLAAMGVATLWLALGFTSGAIRFTW